MNKLPHESVWKLQTVVLHLVCRHRCFPRLVPGRVTASMVLLLFVLCQIFMLQTKKARIQVLQDMDFQGLSYNGMEHECWEHELFWKPSLCAHMQKACYSGRCQCVSVLWIHIIWLYNVVFANTSVKRTYDMHTKWFCMHTHDNVNVSLMQYTK